MTRADKGAPAAGTSRVRATLVRVLIVQAVALALLGLLQTLYTP